MKNLVALFLSLFIFQYADAQLTGKVNSADGSPIPYTVVSLMYSVDSSLVRSVVTNEQGLFQMESIKTGSYLLKISSIGFTNYTSPTFALTTNNQSKNFGIITLQPTARQLSAVVIRASKPVITNKAVVWWLTCRIVC